MSSAYDEPASFTPDGICHRGVRADPSEIALLRGSMRRWLAQLPLDDDCRQDILLASYEALANAVEHAYTPGDPAATLDFEALYRPADGQLHVLVTDHGVWHDASDDESRRSRGHGLTLIRNLTSEMTVDRTPEGTVVDMRWSLNENDTSDVH
ncbi:ATP-binding protein [Rhodococcus sp. (in: high G+C Gram-positive bacteria)]|uniref:ATP-binding protein n=1 Tax=Rhodococcus sp. TaxID=1831 RepID=UPI00388D16A5